MGSAHASNELVGQSHEEAWKLYGVRHGMMKPDASPDNAREDIILHHLTSLTEFVSQFHRIQLFSVRFGPTLIALTTVLAMQ
jgi:hypothetical protein